MNSLFYNFDDSKYSKVLNTLLQYNGVYQSISDISNFSNVPYDKVKIIIKRMHKLDMLDEQCISGHKKYIINNKSKIIKCFIKYHSSVIDKELKLINGVK